MSEKHFVKEIKHNIEIFVRKHPYPGYCWHTVQYVLREMGFKIFPEFNSNIDKTIKYLLRFLSYPSACTLKHSTAQGWANNYRSENPYLVIVAAANYGEDENGDRKGGVHHIGIGLPGKLDSKDSPVMGGGGLDIKNHPEQIKQALNGRVSFHFSWGWVADKTRMSYGGKAIPPMHDTKDHMYYFKYPKNIGGGVE